MEGVDYGPIQARLDKAQRGAGYHGGLQRQPAGSASPCTRARTARCGGCWRRIGLKVNRLVRLAYGPFALTTLPLGALEEVGPRVIREQLADYIAPEDLPTGGRAATALTLAPVRRAAAAIPVGDGGVAAPKKVYKPGWAKPAKKTRPVPKASAKRHAAAKRKSEGPAADAVVHARPTVSKPGVAPRPESAAGKQNAPKSRPARGPRPPRPAR